MLYRFLAAALLAVFPACSAVETTPAESFMLIESPSGEISGQPNIYTDEKGRVVLSWVEPDGESGHLLKYSRFDGEKWSDAAVAAQGENWFVNWADLPAVKPMPGGRMLAWYLVSNSENTYGYDIHMRIKSDEGKWSDSIHPHFDDTPTQHGFVSAEPLGDFILAGWLDGRESVGMSHNHDEMHGGEGTMTLRSAVLDYSGNVVRELLVDGYVCSCCPTSMTSVPEGVLIAYRDRTKDEVRDISLALFDGNGWDEPFPLHEDGWQVMGCPVNGPSLASFGYMAAAAWYTGEGGSHRVQIRFSEDGGRSFGEPVLVDDNQPMGRVGVTALNPETVLMTWQGFYEEKPALMSAIISVNGTILEKRPAAWLSSPGLPITPRVSSSGDAVYAAWTEINPKTGNRRVKVGKWMGMNE